jgi:mono/diheme cytochrome c family protein
MRSISPKNRLSSSAVGVKHTPHVMHWRVCGSGASLVEATRMAGSKDRTFSQRHTRTSKFFAVLIWLVVVGNCGAASQKIKPSWQAPEDAKKVRNPFKVTPEGLRTAAQLYQQNCMICHGKTGEGNGPGAKALPQKPANFTDAKLMSKASDGELFWKIGTGRAPMPTWQVQLTDTQRWELVNYIRTFARR